MQVLQMHVPEKRGWVTGKATAEKVNKLLQIPTDEVLVASTGVIGMRLPIDRIPVELKRWSSIKWRYRERT